MKAMLVIVGDQNFTILVAHCLTTRIGLAADGHQVPWSLPTNQDEVSLPDVNRSERLVADYQVIAFSTNDHPMSIIRPTLDNGISSTIDLDTINDGAQL